MSMEPRSIPYTGAPIEIFARIQSEARLTEAHFRHVHPKLAVDENRPYEDTEAFSYHLSHGIITPRFQKTGTDGFALVPTPVLVFVREGIDGILADERASYMHHQHPGQFMLDQSDWKAGMVLLSFQDDHPGVIRSNRRLVIDSASVMREQRANIDAFFKELAELAAQPVASAPANGFLNATRPEGNPICRGLRGLQNWAKSFRPGQGG